MAIEYFKKTKPCPVIDSDWSKWLVAADDLYLRYYQKTEESPFFLNEIARVGFLASAAALAGFLPLSEYSCKKLGKKDKRRRVDGRADLWFDTGQRCYSFEFKTAYLDGTRLHQTLYDAQGDIARVLPSEYDYAAAGLIARVCNSEAEEKFRAFANCRSVDWACRLGPQETDGAFLFFRLAKR
jgi:hypothetical protein